MKMSIYCEPTCSGSTEHVGAMDAKGCVATTHIGVGGNNGRANSLRPPLVRAFAGHGYFHGWFAGIDVYPEPAPR